MSVGDLLDRQEDRPAYVRFERRAVKDAESSLREGRHVSKDEDWALITPPYSKDCVEKKVSTWFEQTDVNVRNGRIPERHFEVWKESYNRWMKGQEEPVDGTSVKEWSTISPAQCANLIAIGCKTIEDVAACNDEGLRRMGMGANDLKNKAIAWLQAAKDHGPLTMQVTALQSENATLKGSIDSLQEQIKLLSMQLDSRQVETVSIQRIDGISSSDILPSPAELYEEKFGKKPHHLMKESTILEKLNS